MNIFASLANVFMNSGVMGYTNHYPEDSQYHWVDQLCGALDSFLVPLLIIVATAGMIYAVVLGVNLARADSSDKQQEAKKRLVYAIVGLVSILVLILLLKLFIANVGNIIGTEYAIDGSGSGETPASGS